MKELLNTVFAIVFYGVFSAFAQAGAPQDLETGIPRETPPVSGPSESNSSEPGLQSQGKNFFNSWVIGPLAKAVFNPIFHGVVDGAVNSYRYALDKFNFVKPDIGGNDDALLPFFRLATGKHVVSPSVDGNEFDVSAGFGPIAVEFRQNRYWETGDTMEQRLDQWRLHFRFLAYDRVALGISGGRSRLSGKIENSGMNWHIPLLVKMGRDVYINIENGMWNTDRGGAVGDHALELRYGSHYFSTYLGYHWLLAPEISKRGPTAGLSFYF